MQGTVLIAAFGLPPLSHEDDAARGVFAALEIHSSLLAKHEMDSSIGVTTGECRKMNGATLLLTLAAGQLFSGVVGSDRRREFAMVGDIVNLSARLMVAAMKMGVRL